MKVTLNYKKTVSKHFYECSNVIFKIMPVHQTNDYSLLRIKEKKKIQKKIYTYIKQSLTSHTNTHTCARAHMRTHAHTTELLAHTHNHKHIHTNYLKIYL